MRVTLLVIGKTDESYLRQGIEIFAKRIGHYVPFKIDVIPDIKRAGKLDTEQIKKLEGEKIIAKDAPGKELHLFDEKGINYTSKEFAEFIEKKMISGLKELIFVVGGPFGFSDALNQKAISKISLSRMTFTHQLARLLCTEQIYRAFTIINNDPYHND
jgi:23S rRNA (pseudouridine1915-N3)-methyltransferase